LAHRVARHPSVSGIDGLAAAMLIAAVAVTPMGGWAAAPAALDPVALLAGVGVGLSSSVIPYVTDQLPMARLSRATYAPTVSPPAPRERTGTSAVVTWAAPSTPPSREYQGRGRTSPRSPKPPAPSSAIATRITVPVANDTAPACQVPTVRPSIELIGACSAINPPTSAVSTTASPRSKAISPPSSWGRSPDRPPAAGRGRRPPPSGRARRSRLASPPPREPPIASHRG